MTNGNSKSTGRQILIALIAVVLILAGYTFIRGFYKARHRPNVLLIVLDTARASQISCMGYHRKTTPHIDALASEGIIYRRAYTPSCWTLPSHAALFTGLYPIQAASTSETLHLPSINTTVAEVLAGGGYETAAFICNAWVSKERGFAQGFNEFHEMWRGENASAARKARSPLETIATEKIIGWLEKQKEKKKPFFLFINLSMAHLPYRPPEPFLSRFISPGYNNKEANRMADVTSMWPHLAGRITFDEKDYRILRDLYDGEIAFADDCVGRIIDCLRDSGIIEKTVVIVTSDHGENLGEHGRIDHNLSMYETTLHVPLVIRYPRLFKPGSVSDEFVNLVDIAPTIMDLCGTRGEKQKNKLLEISLVREERPHRSFVVAGNERPLNAIGLMKKKYPEFDANSIDHKMRAIRTTKHKLIWNVERNMELFELTTDADELHNLADTQAETSKKLHNMLRDYVQKLQLNTETTFFESKDAESLEVLRSLGYVE
jgi:arylsulfatase A-like enzyme